MHLELTESFRVAREKLFDALAREMVLQDLTLLDSTMREYRGVLGKGQDVSNLRPASFFSISYMVLYSLGGEGEQVPREYVPGKCNISTRGKAWRAVQGLVILGLTLVLGIILLPPSLRLLRLLLFIPLVIGLVFELESGLSFCTVHALRGTYDFHEKYGWPYAKTETRSMVENEEWKRIDRRKARLMYYEAAVGGLLLAILVALVP